MYLEEVKVAVGAALQLEEGKRNAENLKKKSKKKREQRTQGLFNVTFRLISNQSLALISVSCVINLYYAEFEECIVILLFCIPCILLPTLLEVV